VVYLAINWDKAYENISTKNTAASKKGGGIDWDAAYKSIDEPVSTPTLSKGEYTDENGLIVPPPPFEVPKEKTPLNQSRYNVVGQGIIPRYQEDAPLSAIGKDVVNYGGGTLLKGLSGLSQGMMQGVSNIGNAVQGKPLDFSPKSLRKDILPKGYGQFVDTLAQKGPLGQVASGFIQGAESLIQPETWIGGLGIVDDLAKSGLAGKSATLGTIENLEANAAAGLKASTKKVKGKLVPILSEQTATKGYLNAERNSLKKNAIKTPDIIYSGEKSGQTTDNLSRLALPAPAKQEPFTQVKYSTLRQPKADVPVKEISKTKTPLPELVDNNVKPLKKYTNTLYHETSLDDSLPFIDKNYMKDIVSDVYLSNNIDLALGQGKNKGVLIEFEPNSNIKGFVSKAKPTWEMSYANNDAEFIARYNRQSDYLDSVKSVTIKPEAQGSRTTGARLKRVFEDWEKVNNTDGSTTYIRPSEQQKSIVPQIGTQQIGKGMASTKTLQPKLQKQTVFNTNTNIEQPLKALRSELPKQSLQPPELKGNTVNQSTKTTAANGVYDATMPPPKSKIVSSEKKTSFNFKDAWNKFYTRVVDTNNPIKKTGEDTYIKATNAKNVSGVVDHNLTEALVDRQGNKIGNSLKQEVEAIPKGKEESFWDYMLHRNNIDRAREKKPVYPEYTPEMSTEVKNRFESADPEFKTVGDNITKWIDNFTKEWGVNAGIIDKDVYSKLRETYKSYIPTNRDFSTLEDAIPQNIKSKFVDQRTPIRKATGSERDIVNPVENIMNLVNRTIRTAKYNEVGQSLLESVRKDPDKLKNFAEVITDININKNLDNIVTVMEHGKPVYLQINDKYLLDSLNGVAKNINNLKAVRAATNVYKSLITQKNPIFALFNIFRDVPTSYVYGSTKNPIKFFSDLGKASKDVITNSENLQRYKAVGGGGSNFFNSGNVAKSAKDLTGGMTLKKVLTSPIKAIETFNNLTETAPRLAEFNRIYQKTGDINKALYAANDVTVNFSRGGDITKTVDAFVPYLNAGVQGLDKFFRGFKDPKTALATIAKSGVAITTPTVVTYLINRDNPNYQQLDNRTKDTYYLIPNLADKDDKGYAKTFIKIPKSRELSVLFSVLIERSLRAVDGEKSPFKGFGNTLATSFSPSNPVENNILAPFTYNIPTNKDFANRSIVPQNMVQDKRSAYLQYDEKTSEISKKIGELTKDIGGGLSPKQIDYLIRSYTGVVGQMGLPLSVKGSDPTQALTSRFKVDPLYSNQTLTDFYDNYDKLQKTAADKNILGKIPSKATTPDERIEGVFRKASTRISDLNKEIRKLDQVKDKARIEELRRQILEIAKNTNNMLK
jgi:hypothetical protein